MAFCFFFLSWPPYASFLSRRQPYAGSYLDILLPVYVGRSIPINMTFSFISAGIFFAQPIYFFSMPAHTFLSRQSLWSRVAFSRVILYVGIIS
jgi:hypothetical protein